MKFLRGLQQRQLAFHRHFQQLSGDDQAVDFVRAFKNAVDAGVAVRAGDWVLLAETVTTEHLHAFVCDLTQHFRAVHLDDAGLDAAAFNRFEFVHASVHERVDLAGDAVRGALSAVNRRSHLTEFFNNRAVARDWLAETMAILRVFSAVLQDRFAAADAARTEFVAPDVEDVEGDLCAATDDTE